MNKKTINVNVDLDDKQAKKKLEELEKRKYKVNLDVDDSGVKNTTQSVRNLSKTTDETNNIFGKLKNTISQTFSAGKLQMAAYLTVIKEINDAGERAKQTIEDIDKAVTDLQIATDMSRESVQGLVKGYNDYGKQLGATTTQITAAADDYLRAGKTLNESQALIKDSIMLSKLGQIDSGEATSDLLAVMNGYKMSVDEVGKALDSMVALDMKAATSSGDIATAMKYSASSAEVAGLSFNKLAAMIAVVQDRTQQSAETIGTFYNTLLSRYRDIKIGKFITDEGENISDFESVLKSVGISLCDSSGEFRAFETIIEEVAGKWNMLSSVQRAALAKAQSGTRQQNRYYALMEGYADVLKLTEVAAQSAGTAIDKYNESYMNSLDAKKASLQASFESMIINANLDTVYADIIDCTKSLVDFINKTNALKGVFTGIAVGTGIKAFLSLKTGINEAYISLNKFHNALSMVKQGNIDTSSFQRLLLLSNGLSASQTKLLLSTKNLSTTQKEQILVNQGLSKEEAKLQLQAWGLTTANTGLTAATTSLGNAFKGLFATLMANPIIIVTAAVSGAVMAWQSYNQKIEETRRKNIEMAESASEQAGELTKLYVKYETLNKIQDRTASQEEQLKIVVNEITGALGDKASALEGLTEGTKEYTEVLKNATKEELENYYATAKIGAKAAEDELKGKAWDGFWGSKVTIRQNENMTGNKKHMAALNEVKDILSAYEDVGSQGLEWEPINWDKDRDNMDAVVDYYNALIEARNKLATSPNADSLMDTNIYKSINTTINDLTDSVEKYTKQKYESLKLEYMYNEGIPATEEEFKKMEQSILDASGAGEEFKNILKNYLAEDFSLLSGEIDGITESVENLQETAEQVSKVTLSTTDALASIQSLSKGLDQLDKIYADVLNKEDFDWSSILNNQGFIEAFGNMENVTDDYKNAYDDFIRVISNSPTNINACQNAFNNLATAYIYNSGALQNVTAETKQATIAMLEQMGVSNATAIVTAQLAANEIAAQVATNGLSNATYGAITALTNEGNACSETVNALFDLITKTEIFANTSLNTESKIRELENLATAFGLTAATAGDWSNSKEWAYAKAHGVTEETYLGILQDRYKEQIQKQFKPVKVNYTGGTTTKNTQASLNKGSGNKGSTTKQKDTKQIIDWIDQKLKVLGKRLDVIKTKAAEVYSTFKNQNKELDKAISNLERQIEVQKSAKKKYLDKANKVGLSKDLKTKVQNGNMSIKDYDSKTAEKIKEYQEWYEKAKDVDEIIQQLKLDIQELAKQKLENIVDDFDRKNSYQQALMNLREAKMGDNPKESDYNYLIKKQNHIKYNAQKEYNLLKKQFDELVNEGKIKKGSDAWYEWMEKLVDVELSIEDCDIALEEFQKTVRELRWKKFNEAIEKLERINDTINDTKSLLSGDLFDDGKLTQTGKATILLNFQGMANAKQEIEEHKNAIKALGEELANKTITQEEYDKAVAEHIKLQNQAALSMKQYYDDIINIGVQAIDEETEAFRKKTEEERKNLQAERDLHNYRKSIEEKEDNIVVLRKKIAQLSKSTDRKDIALRLKLEEQLAEDEKDLAETEYQHNMDMQEKALDDELENYEKSQEEKKKDLRNNLDAQKALINKYLGEVQANYDSTMNYIIANAEPFSFNLTELLKSPFTEGIKEAETYKSLLDSITSDTKIDTSKIDTGQLDKTTAKEKLKDRILGMNLLQAQTAVGVAMGTGQLTVDEGAKLLAEVAAREQKENASNGSNSSGSGKKTEDSKNNETVKDKVPENAKVSKTSGNIKRGMTGKDVETVQRALKALGYDIGSTGVDGIFGTKTKAAVQAFQKDKKKGTVLPADGIVGTETKKKFKANKYAKGLKNATEDELAELHENGGEIIMRDGRILEPIKKGDWIFTAEQTQNLYKLSEMNPYLYAKPLSSVMPQIQQPVTNTNNNVGDTMIDASVHVSGLNTNELNKVLKKNQNETIDKIAKAMCHGLHSRM